MEGEGDNNLDYYSVLDNNIQKIISNITDGIKEIAKLSGKDKIEEKKAKIDEMISKATRKNKQLTKVLEILFFF